MKVGIIGAGRVGSVLAGAWAAAGHTVIFGVRTPADRKYQSLLDGIDADVRILPVSEAVRESEVVLLAVPWNAAPDTIGSCGDLTGKVVIDCTNPVKPDLDGLTIGHTTSAAEQIAGWAAGSRVVKCFNTVGTSVMEQPIYTGLTATMPLCGDDDGAKADVAILAEDAGFEPIDVGPLTMARQLEPMAMLWIYLSVHRGFGSDFAWKLLRR